MTYNTYVTRNITYSTIVTYITITNTTNITDTFPRQLFFLPFQQHFVPIRTYISLQTKVYFHLFLTLATVPFLFAIYFSVSNVIFIFFKKDIKIRENASFSTFSNTQFSENYEIIYDISSI